MRTIGVRELEARLTEFLGEVQRGAVILITDRKRVIAELGPPTVAARPSSAVERALTDMAAGGDLRLGEPAPDPYPVSPLTNPAGTARRWLAAERGAG